MAALRAQLGQVRAEDWQKAGAIMQNILCLTGESSGPSGGSVQPRVCRMCGFYGHTANKCPRAKSIEVRQAEKELLAYRRWKAEQDALISGRLVRKGPRGQGEVFDRMGIPWVRDSRIGPTVFEGEGGEGKWYRDADGGVRLANLAGDGAGCAVIESAPCLHHDP